MNFVIGIVIYYIQIENFLLNNGSGVFKTRSWEDQIFCHDNTKQNPSKCYMEHSINYFCPKSKQRQKKNFTVKPIDSSIDWESKRPRGEFNT